MISWLGSFVFCLANVRLAPWRPLYLEVLLCCTFLKRLVLLSSHCQLCQDSASSPSPFYLVPTLSRTGDASGVSSVTFPLVPTLSRAWMRVPCLAVCRCWATDPAERPSVDMLLECLDLMIEDRREQQA